MIGKDEKISLQGFTAGKSSSAEKAGKKNEAK